MNKYLEKIALNKYEKHLTLEKIHKDHDRPEIPAYGERNSLRVHRRLTLQNTPDMKPDHELSFFFPERGDSLNHAKVNRTRLFNRVIGAKLALGAKTPPSKLMAYARKLGKR